MLFFFLDFIDFQQKHAKGVEVRETQHRQEMNAVKEEHRVQWAEKMKEVTAHAQRWERKTKDLETVRNKALVQLRYEEKVFFSFDLFDHSVCRVELP